MQQQLIVFIISYKEKNPFCASGLIVPRSVETKFEMLFTLNMQVFFASWATLLAKGQSAAGAPSARPIDWPGSPMTLSYPQEN